MASSGNFCTLNPLAQPNSGTFSEGNLLFTHTTSDWRTTAGTFGMTTGKWYWEAYQYESLSGNGFPVGIYDISGGKLVSNQASAYPGRTTSTYGLGYAVYTNSGTYASKYTNQNETNTSLSIGVSGDVWQCAFDADNGKIWFGKNNTWDNSGNPATGTSESYATIPSSTWVPVTCSYNDSNSENYPQNFGQNGSFSGRITDAGNADGNGHGSFKYSPPSGYLALCSANLPISEDIDPAETDDDHPQKQFGVLTYTGNGTSRTLSGLGFQPDLIWTKRLSGTSKRHYLVDSSRGFTKYLHSDGTFTQGTSSDGVTSATSDGFAVGGSLDYVNENTSTYVAWCWRANGGTTSTNTQGTATSTVQANTKAGFSICLTDNYTAATGVTIGHGLGKAPAFYIHKTTGDNSSGGASQNFTWHVYHKSLGATKAMFLDTNAGASTAIGYWNNTEPTSTVLSLGNTIAGNGQSLVYAWSEIEGFSKFGEYVANTNNDGPFIYTGFRPRLVWIKMTVTGDHWGVWDSERATVNDIDNIVTWSTENAESSNAYYSVDFLSSGFKIRSNNAQINHESYDPYIWGAWADVPFKYNNTF